MDGQLQQIIIINVSSLEDFHNI